MERHFSDSHDINVKFTKKVVELERIPRDWREISSFFLLFLSTFRFIIQENLYYIFPNYERNFFLLMFSFLFSHIYLLLFIYNGGINFYVFEMCVIF